MTGRRSSALAAAIGGLAIVLAVVLGGCGSRPPATSSPAPAATAIPPSASGSVTASGSDSASASLSGATPPTEAPHAVSVAPTGVAPDPSLLDLVPAADAGATLTYDPQTTASVAADPSLARDASYLAIGLARVTGADASDPNFAIVNAVRLRATGATDETWFRDWRDTYDQAACAQAGGVGGHAQTEVDTLVVFVTTCVNDAFTYHVRVADGLVVLSITSVGPADLGRRIVEKLHR